MNDTRAACAAGIAGLMRAPLSRVELAASQLARSASTPAARELSESIRSAVGDLERLIDELFELWAPPQSRSDGVRCGSLALLLSEMHDRFGPVFAARGIDWSLPTQAGSLDVPAEPAVREIAVQLLRAGADLAGSGGSMSLVASRHRPDRAELLLSVRHANSAMSNATARVLDALAPRLRRCGGEPERRLSALAGHSEIAVTWTMEATCSAS